MSLTALWFMVMLFMLSSGNNSGGEVEATTASKDNVIQDSPIPDGYPHNDDHQDAVDVVVGEVVAEEEREVVAKDEVVANMEDMVIITEKPSTEEGGKKEVYRNFKRMGPTGHTESGLVTPTAELMAKQRVFCMVPFIYNEEKINLDRYDSITKTYGKRCDVLRFMSDKVPGDYPEDVVSLTTLKRKPNDRQGPDRMPAKHIWEKVWRSWVHVAENYIDSAEWFTKIDHDTYFFPDHIKHLVVSRNWSADDTHYFGQKLYHRKDEVLFNAGAAVTFSRATVKKMGVKYQSMGSEERWERGICIDHAGATEEMSTAHCLREVGVLADDALDEFDKDTIMTFYPHAHLNMLRDPDVNNQGWWWKHKPDWVQDGEQCCSTHPIGFHNVKNVRDFYDFEEIFYGTKPMHKNQNHMIPDEVTLKYYERVRKAIRDISLPEPKKFQEP